MKNLIAILIFSALTTGAAFSIAPQREYSTTPATLGIPYDSLSIPTPDGERLCAWYIPTDSSDKAPIVVIAGGDVGNMSDQLNHARYYAQFAGANALLFDYRGFGASTDFETRENVVAYPQYGTDLEAILNFLKFLPGDTNKIYIHGLSMGAGLALSVAAIREDVAGVFCESPFASQTDLAARLNARIVKTDPNFKMTTIESDYLEPINLVDKINAEKVFIIAGEDDPNIPYTEVFRLYEKCSAENKSLWIAGDTEHVQASNKYAESYLAFIRKFVKL